MPERAKGEEIVVCTACDGVTTEAEWKRIGSCPRCARPTGQFYEAKEEFIDCEIDAMEEEKK